MLSIADILKQGRDTMELCGYEDDGTEAYYQKLWEFTFATFAACDEDDGINFSVKELEDAFNKTVRYSF